MITELVSAMLAICLQSIILYPVHVDLAHAVYIAIVIDEVQLTAPAQVLPTLWLVEFNLQRQRQYLAILEFQHRLHLCACLVFVHLESVR